MGTDWSAGKAGRDLDPAADTSAPPKSDTIWKKLSVFPYAPGALRLDKQWQQGVPDPWPAVGQFLRQETGHDFPVLSRMRNARAKRAVASMLRENLNSDTTVIGLEAKVLAGAIFAAVVADEPLAEEIRALGSRVGVPSSQLGEAREFAVNAEAEAPAADPKVRAALLLARASSPSPADITAAVVEACRQSGLSSPAIVELIAWLSVLQMLHRLSSYFVADKAVPSH